MFAQFFVALALLSASEAISLKQGGNMNEYMDAVLVNARQYIIDHGYNNLPLPSDGVGFSEEIFPGIEVSGSASVDNGFLRGLETIARNGDATAELVDGLLVISTSLTFADIIGGYDCHAEFIDIGISADVQIDVENVDFWLRAAVDLTKLASQTPGEKIGAQILDFQINHIGDINIDLDLGPLDWVLSQLVSLIVDLLDDTIYNALEGPILEALQEALNDVAPPSGAAIRRALLKRNSAGAAFYL